MSLIQDKTKTEMDKNDTKDKHLKRIKKQLKGENLRWKLN